MQLTDATMVEVEAGLGGQAGGGHWAVFPWCARGNRAVPGGVPLPLLPKAWGSVGTYQAV